MVTGAWFWEARVNDNRVLLRQLSLVVVRRPQLDGDSHSLVRVAEELAREPRIVITHDHSGQTEDVVHFRPAMDVTSFTLIRHSVRTRET